MSAQQGGHVWDQVREQLTEAKVAKSVGVYEGSAMKQQQEKFLRKSSGEVLCTECGGKLASASVPASHSTVC